MWPSASQDPRALMLGSPSATWVIPPGLSLGSPALGFRTPRDTVPRGLRCPAGMVGCHLLGSKPRLLVMRMDSPRPTLEAQATSQQQQRAELDSLVTGVLTRRDEQDTVSQRMTLWGHRRKPPSASQGERPLRVQPQPWIPDWSPRRPESGRPHRSHVALCSAAWADGQGNTSESLGASLGDAAEAQHSRGPATELTGAQLRNQGAHR